MAEPQETRQEQEARWATRKATRDKAFQAGQHARRKKNWRLLTVAVIVIIVAVIVAIILL